MLFRSGADLFVMATDVDAVYTGWTNGNVELLIAPGDREAAIYLRRGDLVERWPRAVDPWGVIDCN